MQEEIGRCAAGVHLEGFFLGRVDHAGLTCLVADGRIRVAREGVYQGPGCLEKPVCSATSLTLCSSGWDHIDPGMRQELIRWLETQPLPADRKAAGRPAPPSALLPQGATEEGSVLLIRHLEDHADEE